MLTLLRVSGYTMAVNPNRYWYSDPPDPIDRDELLIPEILIETYDIDPAKVMKPLFDAIWNAAGWPYSLNYDDEGNWVGQR